MFGSSKVLVSEGNVKFLKLFVLSYFCVNSTIGLTVHRQAGAKPARAGQLGVASRDTLWAGTNAHRTTLVLFLSYYLFLLLQ